MTGVQTCALPISLNKPDKNANCSPHVLSAGLAVMPGESRAFTVICLSFTPPLCTFCIVDVFLFCDFFLGTTNVSYQVKVKCPASDVSCRAPGGESAGVGLPARGHSAALALGLLCAQIQGYADARSHLACTRRHTHTRAHTHRQDRKSTRLNSSH